MTDTTRIIEDIRAALESSHPNHKTMFVFVASIRALLDHVAAQAEERYKLAYAITGGEDAPGLIDSLSVEQLVEIARSTTASHYADIDRAEAAEARVRELEGGVAVKPLEWKDGYRDAGCKIIQASTLPFYQVRVLEGVVWLDADNTQTVYPTVEAAKTAAQADYEYRIRSALASQAQSGETDTPPPSSHLMGLTLSTLQRAHVDRQEEWCPDQKPDLSFRGNELGGECGEAQNVIKKLERERHGWRGSRDTVEHLAEELADVIHCAILVAITARIEIEPAVIAKFNSTSEKNGLSTMLRAALTSEGSAE